MAHYVTIRVRGSKDDTHFKLRLDQKLGVMFREYSRRRDNLAYSFLLDGEAVDAEHTARLLVLRDQDVIIAEKQKDDNVAHVPVAAQRKPGSAASPAAPGAAAPGAAAETGDALEDPGGVPSGPVAHGNSQGVAGSTSVVTRDASEDVLAAVARAVDDDGDDDASARALRRTLAAASPACLAKTVSATTVDALGTTFARFSRGAGPAGRVVVVSGLAASATSIDVATLLEPHGAVEACALVAGGGAACARFEAAEAANRAVVAGATEASGTRVAVAHLVAALPPPPRPPPGAASAGGTAMPAAPAEAGGGSGEAAARAAGAAGGGATAAGGWAPQARPTTVVCRWVVPDFETARRSDAARAHKGMYHDAGFVDAAGNRWLLYYFLDGDGADNAGHVSLYLSVRDAATLPFGWQKHATFTMSVDHASGDASYGYAKWATQVFRAAPPPAVQDWGWPKFAAHAELRARDLIGTDGALRVRATVTVSVSSTDIARSDADACLLAAARTGAADAVRRCLRAGADAAHRDVAAGSARTPLHLACARGHRADADAAAAAIVPVLAAAGADIDAEDAHGETALHLAVAKGASRAARALLRAGADPARPVRGATPREDALTLAAGAGRAELASALISAGAPPSGEAALLAARKGHLDVLWPVLDAARADDRLPELVAARNARGDTAVALLVARGDVDAAARLVADYRAPLADCSRDRKAARHARLRIMLKQRERARCDGNGGEGGETAVKVAAAPAADGPAEAARRSLVEELEAEEAEREVRSAKAREKKKAKRQKQRRKKEAAARAAGCADLPDDAGTAATAGPSTPPSRDRHSTSDESEGSNVPAVSLLQPSPLPPPVHVSRRPHTESAPPSGPAVARKRRLSAVALRGGATMPAGRPSPPTDRAGRAAMPANIRPRAPPTVTRVTTPSPLSLRAPPPLPIQERGAGMSDGQTPWRRAAAAASSAWRVTQSAPAPSVPIPSQPDDVHAVVSGEEGGADEIAARLSCLFGRPARPGFAPPASQPRQPGERAPGGAIGPRSPSQPTTVDSRDLLTGANSLFGAFGSFFSDPNTSL